VNEDDEAPPTVRAGLKNSDVERLRASFPPEAGTFGEGFEILGEAGAGGMGYVYEAIDRDSGGRVALKVIAKLPSPSDRARFNAEAEVLERLAHPAIVNYVRHGVTARGEPYLAMEWLVGESLSVRLQRGPLSLAETVMLGERIADALAHAHAAGIVHRDLKPSNIFLVDGKVEQAHLIDFGVAKVANQDLTQTGQMVGTPGYMAPEQVRGEKTVDRRADLFALGCVLYRALTGRAPFEGVEIMEILARLLLEQPPALEELVPDVPPRLVHLLGSMMAKDPARRLGDAKLASSELRAIREAIIGADASALELRPEMIPAPSLATLVEPTISASPRVRARIRRRTLALIIALGIAAIASTAAIVMLLREPSWPACSLTTPLTCVDRCNAGDADACYIHARTLHKNDLGIRIDHEAARVADKRACSLGNDKGCYEAAASLLRLAKNAPPEDAVAPVRRGEAAKLLALACDRNYHDACRELGKQYSVCCGQLEPDPVKAFALVEKSCRNDLISGCNALHDMIKNKAGTPELRAHALEVYRAACARKLPLTCEL
jgi:serine/threonine protein kinase